MVTFIRPDDPPEEELPKTFIDAYAEWAHTVTDAPVQYHKAIGVSILSATMAPHICLPTQQATFVPNIWIMILAGTTVTRKSTSLDMARQLLDDVLDDYLLANDGSPEGLLTELSTRDGKVSLFHRDEITGFMDAIIHKDYMAGTIENLTRLYDGQPQTRILRREKIEIKNPYLVIMSGGIKSRMEEIISMEHIRTGFIPRFIFVTGTTTPEQMRPLGPPLDDDVMMELGESPRQAIVDMLWQIKHFYNAPEPTTEDRVTGVGDDGVISIKLSGAPSAVMKPKAKRVKLQGTPEFWTRLEQLDRDSVAMGLNTSDPVLYGALCDRLKNSIIKVAILICGADLRDKITAEDLQKAIHYGEEWLQNAMQFALAVEQKPDMNRFEKKIEKIANWIKMEYPTPHSQTEVMQKFRIRKSEISDIEETLMRRGMVYIKPHPASNKTPGTKIWYYVPDSFLAAKGASREDSYVVREDEKEGGASGPIRIRRPTAKPDETKARPEENG